MSHRFCRGLSSSSTRRFLSLGIGAAIASIFAIAPGMASAQTTGAGTVTACINKKSGAMQYRSAKQAKKKCKKGWTKVTWSVAGPTGPGGATGPAGQAGPAGSFPSVKSADGKTVGTLLGYYWFGVWTILIDGGAYGYTNGGELSAEGAPVWQTADCTGQAYSLSFGASAADVKPADYAGVWRMVYRKGLGTSASPYGPPRAWTGTGEAATDVSNATVYILNTSGTCVVYPYGGPVTGALMPLKELSSVPGDVPGPLSIG